MVLQYPVLFDLKCARMEWILAIVLDLPKHSEKTLNFVYG